MKLKMRENSLFAVLLRSPFWISFAVAAALSLVAAVVLPRDQIHLAIFAGGPFLVIGGIAAWRQLTGLSPKRAAKLVDDINRLSWNDFSAAVEAAYRADGYQVTRRAGAADFDVEKSGQHMLVSGKRWKASRHGVEPLRDLQALAGKEQAQAVYLAAGEVTGNAIQYARENGISLLAGPQLAQFLYRHLPAAA